MATTTPLLTLPVLDPDTVHREVLPNGLRVLVRRDDSAPVVAIVTYVKAGYFDETDEVVGIAHVLEHMFFKGTPARGVGEISKETKAAGGYLNAHTIYDHTSYYAVLPASSFARGLEIQADAYANSLIEAEELRKELEVIIQEAKRKSDNPPAVALETLYELLHDHHRMRRWRIGREPGLRALAQHQLVGFYRNYYRPRNTILSIAGDVTVEEALAHVTRLYGDLPDEPVVRAPGPAEPEHRDFRYREWAGDIAQTQVALGWRTPALLHPDTPLLDIAASVLGTGRASRLYRAVRERKLAASVTAYNYTPTELGVFVVHAETPPATTAEALRAAWAQLAELRESGVGLHELDRARNIFEARWIRRFETMEGQANYLAEWEAAGDWTLGDRYLERLLTATPEQVAAAVRTYLDPNAAGVTVYRPASAPRVAEDADAMRGLLGGGAAPLGVSAPRRPAATPAPVAPPRLEREEAQVRVYRSASGLPILVRRKRGAPMVHLGVYAAGGAVNEPHDEAGLTTLMARTMLKGTARRDATQIAEDAEMLGGSIGVGAGAESVGWSISVPAKHARAALDLLADVVQHATIPEAALETERLIAIADVRMLRDDMYRYPVRLATRAAFRDHPYGTPVSGTEESLGSLSLDRVRAWHRARVLEAPAVVAVVGDVEPDEIADAAGRCFTALGPGERPPLAAPSWPDVATAAVEPREKAQTALAMLFPAPSRLDDDRYAAHLIAGIASGLGGRFFDELRDKRSLAYTVHAFAAERRLAGTFVAYIATSPEREEEARRGLLAEFAKLRETPVAEEELQRAKTYAIGTHAIRQQSAASVLGDVVDAWLHGRSLAELEEFEARVTAVTREGVQTLARRYFDESRRVEGIVRGVGRAV